MNAVRDEESSWLSCTSVVVEVGTLGAPPAANCKRPGDGSTNDICCCCCCWPPSLTGVTRLLEVFALTLASGGALAMKALRSDLRESLVETLETPSRENGKEISP